nr:MAG TPA: hypothetical protein [Caudoviricetes sp.]
MKKFGLGDVLDWLMPVLIGIGVAFIAVLLSGFGSHPERVETFAEMFIPLVFTYATTLLGLSLTCYTLFQTLDNDMVRRIRKWDVYRRFKSYLWHIMVLLVILAVLSLLELFAFDRFAEWICVEVLFGIPVFLTVSTLVALLHWIGLLIKHFDSGN